MPKRLKTTCAIFSFCSPNTRKTRQVIQLFMIWHPQVPVIVIQLPSCSSSPDCSAATINQEEGLLLAWPSQVSGSHGNTWSFLHWNEDSRLSRTLNTSFLQIYCLQHHVMTKSKRKVWNILLGRSGSEEFNKISELTECVRC